MSENSVIEWYEIKPIDTLFFRGNTPMEAGQISCASLFPPPVSVLQGAFWTEACRYKNENVDYKLPNSVFPFKVIACLVNKKSKNGISTYLPAPATWFVDADKDKKLDNASDYANVKIISAKNHSELFEKMGILSSEKEIHFIVPKTEAQSLTNVWVSEEFCFGERKKESVFATGDVLLQKDIYSTETRTGIALDTNRAVQKGKIYTANHIRLKEEISLLVGLDSTIDLPIKGKICLGGEQRLCHYTKLTEKIPNMLNTTHSSASQYVSLAPIQATTENIQNLISSRKFVVVSGWDLEKRFHKPSATWIPAGAVFDKAISTSCVPLQK